MNLNVRNKAKAVGRYVADFVKANPLVTIFILAILGLAVWYFAASVKEAYDKAKFEKRVEKIEQKIEAKEDESKRADAQGDTLNEEGNRKYEDYRESKTVTDGLRTELASRDAQIRRLREQVRKAGSTDSGPTASDRALCERANSLGVKCNLSALED